MFFIKLFAWIFGLYFVFDRLTRKYVNTSKLILMIGKKGAGKTTILTALAIYYINKHRPVYSTESIPGTYKFNPKWLDSGLTIPEGSVLLIDEVGMIWDNRDFKNFSTNTRDFFKLQRHAGITCYMFSQTTDVDKKLRDLCDEIWLVKNFMRVFSIRRRVLKKIGVSKDENGMGQLVDTYAMDSILGGLKFTFIPRYIGFFDSYVLPEKSKPAPVLIPMNEYQRQNLKTSKWMLNKSRESFKEIAKRSEQIASGLRVRAGSLRTKFLRRIGKR